MISVDEAIKLVELELPKPKDGYVPLSDALGMLAAEDIHSPIAMPPFRQSAMDGYALHLYDGKSYEIVREIKAGDGANPKLNPGQAVRIFTGAMVPDAAEAVVMQEHAEALSDTLVVDREISLEQNIRPKGEQVRKGDLALPKGSVLTPATIGFLAGLGITEIKVFVKPSIAILATGNELVVPGEPLGSGKIYESNSLMLQNALKESGYTEIEIFKVKDDYRGTVQCLDHALNSFDVVLVSGGISVGDYDFVGKALQELQVTEVFYKVRQKPGKPLFFGRKAERSVFALPGNPASALTCFYIYVLPALAQLSGKSFKALKRISAKSRSDFQTKPGRVQFLKACFSDDGVEILEGQSSAMLKSFAEANALVQLPADCSTVQPGDELSLVLLPSTN